MHSSLYLLYLRLSSLVPSSPGSPAPARLPTNSNAPLHAAQHINANRTEVEQGKWDNTRRGVAIIGTFVLFVIFALETAPKPPPKPKAAPEPSPEHYHPPPPPLDLREFEESETEETRQ